MTTTIKMCNKRHKIYDEHTHNCYYDKDEIVAPTRRVPCGELKQEVYPTNGLTTNSCCAVWVAGSTWGCRNKLRRTQWLLADEYEVILTIARRSNPNKSNKGHKCSIDTNRLNRSTTKRELKENPSENERKTQNENDFSLLANSIYAPKSVINGTRDTN